MSNQSPLYNRASKEESQISAPSTTSQPEASSMNTTSENYSSHYTSALMAHYPHGSPPTIYRQGTVQHPAAQWDSQPSTFPPQLEYRTVHTNVFYPPANAMMTQQEVAHPQFTPQYPRWTTQVPVQLSNPAPQPQPSSPVNEYFPSQQSPTTATYRQSGEAGPSRNNPRSSRRGFSQDFSQSVPQLDGSSGGEIPEYSPTSASPTRRSHGTASKSVSGDVKSFSCTLCSATFTRKGDCLRHRRSVHTRETPYDCQGCGERFSRSDMRGKHWKADPSCETTHWREVCKAMGKESLVDDN